MTRDQANALLRKHNPLKEADPEGWPTVYMDWVIDAVMEAVSVEREACAAAVESGPPFKTNLKRAVEIGRTARDAIAAAIRNR